MTRVFQALAAALHSEGLDTVFCLLGDGNLDLTVEMADHRGARLIHARHEQGATAMADGYSRRSGRIGFCSVTHGPGLTQTATSLKVAVEHGSRLLMLAGDTPTTDPLHIQHLRSGPFIESLGAAAVPLRAPGRWAADLTDAVSTAATGRPTVFTIPTDYQMADVPELEYRACGTAAQPTAVAESGLAAAVTVLTAAHSPVIVAGRGARGAEAALLAVAERLAAPVVTTLGAKGLANDHPHQYGLIGGLGEPRAVLALEAADCVLAVGTSLSPWSTKGGQLLSGAEVVHLDASLSAFGRFIEPRIRLHGDAQATLRRLVGWLPEGGQELAPREVTQDAPAYLDDVGSVDPRRAFKALEEALPPDRALVLDGGHFITFACAALSVGSAERFLFSCDFATIGQGLAMAIGASVASPGERTTLIVGDGGLLMSIAELDTAVRYRLPLNIVVINDEAYGQEVHSLAAKGLRPDHAVFEVPDLGALGRAFGADGHRIQDAEALGRLAELLTAPGGPRVIDLRVNRRVVSEAASEIFRQVRETVPA